MSNSPRITHIKDSLQRAIGNALVIESSSFINHLLRKAEYTITSTHGGNNYLKILESLSVAINEMQFDGQHDWFKLKLKKICSFSDAQSSSDLAELFAYAHLNYAIGANRVKQINENNGRKGKTPDFEIGNNCLLEVYCPKKKTEDISTGKEIRKSSISTIISEFIYPITGAKNENQIKYATNQVIACIVNSKRSKDQFEFYKHKKNILWLDLSLEFEFYAKAARPFYSENYADTTYIRCDGVWHAFYGEVDESTFPKDRFTLRGHMERNYYYKQKVYTGLFRERSNISAAIITFIDGKIIFLNPWCDIPLEEEDLKGLYNLHQFRPEYSFINKERLISDIESNEETLKHLLKC